MLPFQTDAAITASVVATIDGNEIIIAPIRNEGKVFVLSQDL